MRFSETVKMTDPGLVVSRRHDAWVTKDDHPIFSEEALKFAQRELTKGDRVRKGTVSASSLGECKREQQFVFAGIEKLPMDAKNAMKVSNGSFMHLRWQMAGITEGWLPHAEVPIGRNAYQLSGTMDGVLYEDSVLELKSINMNGFSRVQTFGPLKPHLYQMATYMLCTQREKGVFIYECKDNQEYKEIPIQRDELPIEDATASANQIWEAIESKQLYEPLNDCMDQKGWKYNSCPFRDRCLGIHDWSEIDG
jgi:hypothetical protein